MSMIHVQYDTEDRMADDNDNDDDGRQVETEQK